MPQSVAASTSTWLKPTDGQLTTRTVWKLSSTRRVNGATLARMPSAPCAARIRSSSVAQGIETNSASPLARTTRSSRSQLCPALVATIRNRRC